MSKFALSLLPLFFVACGSSASTDGSGNRPIGEEGGFGSRSDGGTKSTPLPPATDVEAVVTADNAFSFGYGTASAVTTFIRGEGSDGPGIFDCPVGKGPVAFLVPKEKAPSDAYLYIIAWADEYVTQGVLAQFKRVGGQAIYSGDGNWQVCAIGTPFDHHGPGPDQDTVNEAVAACDAGPNGSTYSKGWVTTNGALTPGAIGKLAYGEANDDPGGDFPIVCQKDENGVSGIDAAARWMWFDPQDGESPFVGNAGNRTKTFLVFRLPAEALPPPVK